MSDDLSRAVPHPFDDVVTGVNEALVREGFGVLTDVDVQATPVPKLGVSFPKYRILGTCNPPLAHRALRQEDKRECCCRAT